ncbi:MAG: DEAD/DEAH box helicase [Polyangiaceae bacterium]|nr:DEAD/DEAH box helicase [Polyangiaceae bacterium]
MDEQELAARLGPDLAAAFAERGYTTLTSVQEAALDPAAKDCDLRISSQTGSGKTVAIGLALRDLLDGDFAPTDGVAKPAALVVVPTRELARQVEVELAWLFAKVGHRVASVIGGSSYRDERRALGSGPAIVVGTPGRLLDQLERGAIDPSGIRAVALDEADRMLDMGFRDDIEAIFGQLPEERRTHLVSATFPRDVIALADSVQSDPIMIEGTPLGVANADIDHVIHLVRPEQRTDAIVNLLLARPGAQTLIFARTRADVADLANALADSGFFVSALSGEMEQRERNRALAAFKSGDLDALVATDVAARGIDVQDIARVIHAEPPSDADSYTHRSGRTGRAGKKGTSTVLVVPQGLSRATFLLRRAGVTARVEPLPTAEVILDARDEIVISDLTGEAELAATPDERTMSLAERIIATGNGARAIARLLAQRFARKAPPREVTPVHARPVEQRKERPRPEGATPRPKPAPRGDDWVTFRVTWGEAHGADARRLLAMACRRGNIQGSDIGAIRVMRAFSTIDVARAVADSFATAAEQPDPRDVRVKIQRFDDRGGAPDRRGAPHRASAPHRAAPPYREREREAPPPYRGRPAPHRKGPPPQRENGVAPVTLIPPPSVDAERSKPAGPKHAGPRHAEPKHAEPKHAEPKHPGPKPAGPKHAGPKHAGPKHAAPRPTGKAPKRGRGGRPGGAPPKRRKG